MVGTEWYLWKKKNSWEISRANKKAETKLRDLSEQAQGAAPLPEANASQPLKDLSPSQTKSQPYPILSSTQLRSQSISKMM